MAEEFLNDQGGDTPADDQVVDTQAGDTPSNGEGGAGNSNQDNYFLSVNDRVRYKSKEDAIKGFDAAGQRISELTPFAETAERYGITDPSVLVDVLDDYLRLQEQLEKQTAKEDKGGAAQPVSSQAVNDAQLTEQDRKNIEYLTRHGFTPAKALMEVVDQKLAALQAKIDQFAPLADRVGDMDAQRQAATEESERSYLRGLLKDNNLPTEDQEFAESVEDQIVNIAQRSSYDRQGRLIPGSPMDLLKRGGQRAEAFIADAFTKVMGNMNKLRINADAKYQKEKTEKVARTAKPLPRGGADQVQNTQRQPRRPGAGSIFQNPDLHDKAFDLVQKVGRG